MPKYECRLLCDTVHVLLCNYAMCIYVCMHACVHMCVCEHVCVYECVCACLCHEAEGHHLLVVYYPGPAPSVCMVI